MTAPSKAHSAPRTLQDYIAEEDETSFREADPAYDYVENLFKDGHNRTETNRNAHDAPDYDHAAHTLRADDAGNAQKLGSGRRDTYHSREGTDAAGSYDEDGGKLGGTEDELDELADSRKPVDRTPHMQD